MEPYAVYDVYIFQMQSGERTGESIVARNENISLQCYTKIKHKNEWKKNKTRTKSDKFKLLQRVWHVLHEQRIDYEAFCILVALKHAQLTDERGNSGVRTALTPTRTHIQMPALFVWWKWYVVSYAYDLWCPRNIERNNAMDNAISRRLSHRHAF